MTALSRISAPTVSAVLRRGGLLPVPRSRAGVHVSRGHDPYHVSVSVRLNSDRQAERMVDVAATILAEAGYSGYFSPVEDGISVTQVTRAAS